MLIGDGLSLRSKRFALGLLIWAPVAHAQWGELAKTAHRWFVRTCDDLPGLARVAPETTCKLGAVERLAVEAQKIDERGYLAGLARESALGQECMANNLNALLKTFGDGGEAFADVQRQLRQLRSIQSSLEAAEANQDDATKSLGARGGSAADVNRDVAAFASLKAAQIAAFPFAGHPAIQKYLGAAALKPNGVPTNDRADWEQALKDALNDTQKNKLRWQQRADGKRPFDDQAKSQLSQDPELIEGYFARYPELATVSKSAACAVDREWGRGAAARDAALKWGALAVSTLIVPQARLAARPVAGALIEAATAARVGAMARNVAGAQATGRLLATAAVAGDLAVVAAAVDKDCGASHGSTVVRATNAVQCESAEVRTLGARRCAEVAVLSALGLSLGSPIALSLVQSITKAAQTTGAGLARVTRSFEDARLAQVAPDGAKVFEASRSGVTIKIDPNQPRSREIGRPSGPASGNLIPFVRTVESRVPAAKDLFGDKSEVVTIGKANAPDLKYTSAPTGTYPGVYNIEARDPRAAAASLTKIVRDKTPGAYSDAEVAKLIEFSLRKAKDLNGKLSIRFDRGTTDEVSLRLSVDAAPEAAAGARLVRVVQPIESKVENTRFELNLTPDSVTYIRGVGYTRTEQGVTYTGGNGGHGFGVTIRPEGVEVRGKVDRVMASPEAVPVVDTAREVANLLGRDSKLIRMNVQTEKYETWVQSGSEWVKKD